MADRIGDLLLEEGLVSRGIRLKEALERQKAEGGRLGYHLVRLGSVSEGGLVQILSSSTGSPAIDLRSLYPRGRGLAPVDPLPPGLALPGLPGP